MTLIEPHPPIAPDEAKAIAQDAWIFGMPLVYIELQLDTSTHVSKADKGHAPINQFAHYREFPDASNRTVVGFNVDTLLLARATWILRKNRWSSRCRTWGTGSG